MNNKNFEKTLHHIDLYKTYGEFNFLFEDTIQVYRLLIINLIRISYSYFEDEDENQNELDYVQQDRLLKILMHNMGAMEIVENCRSCFIDFLSSKSKGKEPSFSNGGAKQENSQKIFMSFPKLFSKSQPKWLNLETPSYIPVFLNH